MRKKKLFAKSPIICEPRDNMTSLLYIFGWISRALVHFACVFGSSLFLADSFAITSPTYLNMPKASVGILALICLAVSLCTSLAAFNKKTLLTVPILSLAGFFLTLFAWGNPVRLLQDGVNCVWNTALHRMAEAGYYSFSNYATSNAYAYDQSLCLNVGMAVVAIAFGVIFGLCLIRKGKLVPTAIVCVALLVPVFTYNLTRTNAGMTAAIVFMIAALSMSLYDCRYSGKEFRFIEKRDRKLAKKAAKAQKKAERRAEKDKLKSRAKSAYETARSTYEDKKIAKAAKKAVYTLDKEEKKRVAEALKDEKAAARRRAKREKKELRKEQNKQKKELKLQNRKNRTLAKKDKDLARRLAEEKKSAAKAKAADKKAKKSEAKRIRHEKNERKRYNISAGGFAGLCAVLCAILAVWLPAVIVKGDFPEIPIINGPMSTARAYVSAYLSGDDVDLNDMNMYGNLSELAPRTLSFDPLEFEGTQIFALNTDGQYPIYLKSWMGRSFDEESGTWLGADADQVVEYRSEFGKNFTPDSLKTAINSYLFPTSTLMHSNNAYLIFEKNGFAVGHVNVRRINSASKIVFIPATMNTKYSVMEYGELRSIDTKYSYFYDGIYSSRFFDVDIPYSTASFITSLKHPEVGENMADAQKYVDLALDYINVLPFCEETLYYRENLADDELTEVDTQLGTVTISRNDYSGLDTAFLADAEKQGIDTGLFPQSLVGQYLAMTEEQRTEFVEFIETEKAYNEFAYTAYSDPFGGDKIEELAQSLLDEAGYTGHFDKDDRLEYYTDERGKRVPDHDVIMTAINYLRNNYTYNIAPAAPETVTDSVLNTFLFETKEGYCTHFATAAAALIRQYGYPVRFCEGYITTEFSPDYSVGAVSDYISYLHDDNAHAWIEVYHEILGWTQYEATPVYAEAMYDSDYAFPEEDPEIEIPEETPDNNDPVPEEEETPETQPPEDSGLVQAEPEEPPVDYTRIAIVVGIVAAVAAVIFGICRLVWFFLKKRAKVETDRKLALIHDGLDSERKLKAPEANRSLALELNDQITVWLKIAGFEPEDGEGAKEFAERIDELYGGLCEATSYEVLNVMLKAEFGKFMTADELHILADFAARFMPSVYGGLSPMRKLWWRYIKRLI